MVSCCIFLLNSRGSLAAAGVITVEEYWLEIEDTLAAVQELQRISLDSDQDALENKAVFWESVTQVALPGNDFVTIDASFLVQLLREEPPNLEFIEAHLIMQLDAQQNAREGSDSSGAEEILASILAGEEFQWEAAEESQFSQFIKRFWAKIDEFLDGLFPERTTTITVDLTALFYLVSVVALGIIFSYVFSQMIGSLIPDAELVGSGEEAERITSELAYTRAQESSQTGDNRTAIRFLYLSALLFLEERQVLYYDRTKTNREYMQNVASYPELSEAFIQVVQTFDEAWYGFQEIDEETFRLYQYHVDQLRDNA